MKFKPAKLAPVLITVFVITLICLVRLMRLDFFERQERMTYDMRVREALKFTPTLATNLGFVFMSDETIDLVGKGLLGKSFGLYWPRQIYGHLISELSAQETKAVAFDVIFAGRRPDQSPVSVSLSEWPQAGEFLAGLHMGEPLVTYDDEHEKKLLLMESDEYFAWQLKRAGNTILAADQGVQPDTLFATNSMSVADISAIRDSDGVLRRVKAFQAYRKWHPLFQQVAKDAAYGVDLRKAVVEGGNVVLPRSGLEPIRVPVDANLNFDLADFVGDNIPAGWPKRAKAFIEDPIWHMGIVIAAQELKLDLANAEVNLKQGWIKLHGTGGILRTIPVDEDGYFYINWELPYNHPQITQEPMEDLLKQDMARSAGRTNGLSNRWKNKLVIVGSKTVGNDLTDRGATPIEADTLLASEHWNVANSLIVGRFVRRSSTTTDLLLIVALGIMAALLTWHLRALVASFLVALTVVGYVVLGNYLFIEHRYWLPMILPVAGALLMTHVCLVTWRVVFEQAEKRRVKSIFSRIVSPNIVNELLQAETLSLGGARREVSVLFADVRGFTEFTDTSQERAAAYVAERNLSGSAAEACFNEQARETLGTVNTYLALVADMVKKHDGTLDKYIGDCVMAFWGAPTPNPKHAMTCVRAAMEAQRAVYELNRQREEENRARALAGLPEKPLLPVLLLGSGINTGMVTVGLMGSEAHISNYTVFGRDVNLASRLESLSGRGRILISETTYQCLLRDDPALAAACVALPDANVKGIRLAVKVYEVPWRSPGETAPIQTSGGENKASATTTVVRREKS